MLSRLSAIAGQSTFRRCARPLCSTASTMPTTPSGRVDEDEPEIKVTDQTMANLRQTFFEKSASVARYKWFATRADEEGHVRAADLFRALARSEANHAHNSLDHIEMVCGQDISTGEPIGSTLENLEASLVGEMHDIEKTLPEYASAAVADNNKDIADVFELMAEADQRQIVEIQELIRVEKSRAQVPEDQMA